MSKKIYYDGIKYSSNPRFPQTKNLEQKGNIYLGQVYEYESLLFLEDRAIGYRGNWDKIFGNTNPIYLDLGCGHGDLLAYMSKLYKNNNYIGIDLKYKPLVLTAKKIKRDSIKNALIVRYHIQLLHEIFAKAEISGAYIYYPSPWVKKRYKKNRFFNPLFIENLARVLQKGAFIKIRTDNEDYFLQMKDILEDSNSFQIRVENHNFWQMESLSKNSFRTLFDTFAIRDNLPVFYIMAIRK